jgi:hypothetical protein
MLPSRIVHISVGSWPSEQMGPGPNKIYPPMSIFKERNVNLCKLNVRILRVYFLCYIAPSFEEIYEYPHFMFIRTS